MDHHHHDGFEDRNLKSAYFHVLADALTSVLAIVALSLGNWFGIDFLDPIMGIVGGIIVTRWAYVLSRGCAADLLDAHPKNVDREAIAELVRDNDDEVVDLHVWKNTPKSIACELIVQSEHLRDPALYRTLIEERFGIHHLVVEIQNR